MTPNSLLDLQSPRDVNRLVGGFFNIDKPAGWTSHDVVAKIRGLLRMKRVGHLGTLDPDATGVLPICFEKATKLAAYLTDHDKEYEAVLRLGEETETEDASGKVTRTVPVPTQLQSEAGQTTVRAAMDAFIGPYMQRPPMYSAVKIKGVPLYKTARSGKVIPRASRPVEIQSITFLGMQENDIAFRVSCSKGTYIRTLCSDIGNKLGVGGHLRSIRRTRSGVFRLEQAIDITAFTELCKKGEWTKAAYPLNTGLDHLSSLWVKTAYVQRLLNGVQIGFEGLEKWEPFNTGAALRFLDRDHRLLALGHALRPSEDIPSDTRSVEVPFKVKTILRDR